MRTKCILLFILTVLIGCNQKKIEYNPFDKINLSEKSEIYFILTEGDWGTFEKTYKDFVLADKSAIQKLKDNWKLYKTDRLMACGFGYFVSLTQNGKVVEQIHTNAPCGYATTTGGWYDFDKSYYDFIDVTKIQALTRSEADSIRLALVRQKKQQPLRSTTIN
jgi:hypothetical protein